MKRNRFAMQQLTGQSGQCGGLTYSWGVRTDQQTKVEISRSRTPRLLFVFCSWFWGIVRASRGLTGIEMTEVSRHVVDIIWWDDGLSRRGSSWDYHSEKALCQICANRLCNVLICRGR